MADITLSVAAEIDESISNAQSVLNSIKSQIKGIPKVKIEVDTSGLSSLSKNLDGISKAAKNTGSSSAARGVNNLGQAISGIAASASTAANASNDLNEITERSFKKSWSGTQYIEKYKSALDGSTSSIKGVANAKGELVNVITTESQKYKTQADLLKEQESLQRKENATRKSAYNLISKAVTAQNDYTKAQKSSNDSSKKAYNNIVEMKSAIPSLISQFDNKEITLDEFSKQVSAMGVSFSEYDSTIKSNGDATKTWSDRVRDATHNLSGLFSASQLVMYGVTGIKKMVSETIELDSAMTELKKVTDESDSTYDKFLSKAADRAVSTGAELTDVVTATADFARLGYTIDEASSLADAATIYKNVGDGLSDVSEASESIISTMQAFGVEATDAMSIVDKFNEVGNNFAISSSGIGEALQRSASSLSAAGNTIDESIALVTAANEVVQNPETVGKRICPTMQ